MVQIIVTSEQAKQIEASREAVEIVDDKGNRVGFFAKPFTEAEIAEARRRSIDEPLGSTTEEVLERLSRLESK